MAKKERKSRNKRVKSPDTIGSYFLNPQKEHIEYVRTGSHQLDLMLGGGFPLGRVVNIIGDSGTGKTLIAIETIVNFIRTYVERGKKPIVHYLEGEAAFDHEYAEALGLPEGKVNFVNDDFKHGTMEDWREDLDTLFSTKDPKDPCIYVVDSYDSLTIRETKDSTGGYDKARKAAMLASLLADNAHRFRRNNTLAIINSQVRENLQALPGMTRKRRSGGKALKHYSSQELWLAEKGKERKTINGKRVVLGLHIYAKCTRNKVGLEHRDCDFRIRFGFGIDNILSSLYYLKEVNKLEKLGFKKRDLESQAREIYDQEDWAKEEERLCKFITSHWWDREEKALVKARKYG